MANAKRAPEGLFVSDATWYQTQLEFGRFFLLFSAPYICN